MAGFGGGPPPGLTELNARGKRRQVEMERKAIQVEAGHRRQLARRPRDPRFDLLRRAIRLVRGGGE